MLYLLLAIITSTLIIVTFKLFDRFKINKASAISVNYLVATIFGFSLESGTYSFSELPSKEWFPISIIVGITFITAFYFFALSAKSAGVSITAIASRMSIIFPVMLGFIIFNDCINTLKVVGIVAAVLAFYLTFKPAKNIVINKKEIILPFFLFLAVGLNDSLLKISQHYFIGDDFILFLSTVFFIALIIGLSVSVIFERKALTTFNSRNILAGILLGLFNWFSTFYFLKGMNYIPISVIAPIFNVGVVAFSSIIGYFFFKEKMRKENWLGVFFAIAAILLIAIA